jgi:hypothetical protein
MGRESFIMNLNARGTLLLRFVMFLASCGLSVVNASEKRDVPSQLFGIELGGRHALWREGEESPDGIPVKRAISWEKFLGAGIHVYVEPTQTYSAFEYRERGPDTDGAPPKSNFRLYLLPEITASMRTYEDIDDRDFRWEVASIEWRGELKDEDAYWWAMNLCESFVLDIKIEPEILDIRDEDWYQCKFVEGDREFLVSSWISQSVSLKWNQDVFDKKNKTAELGLRRLELEEIRPY